MGTIYCKKDAQKLKEINLVSDGPNLYGKED